MTFWKHSGVQPLWTSHYSLDEDLISHGLEDPVGPGALTSRSYFRPSLLSGFQHLTAFSPFIGPCSYSLQGLHTALSFVLKILSKSLTHCPCSHIFPLPYIINLTSLLELTSYSLFLLYTHTHTHSPTSTFSWPYNLLQLPPLFSAPLDSKTPRKSYLCSLPPVSLPSFPWTLPSQDCNPPNS